MIGISFGWVLKLGYCVMIEKLNQEISFLNSKLIDQFYIDHLCSIPNLFKLRDDIENLEEFTLISYNLDNFKILNNFYGFIVGDFVLESVARMLKNYFKNEQVYRVAGDEFAILLNKKLDFYELKDFLKTISTDICHHRLEYQGTEIFLDATIASSASKSNENVFSKVNMALKYAKEKGLKFWIYEDSQDISNEYEKNLKFSKIIREALNNSRLIPYFQPIIDNKTEKVVKFEVLSRLLDENENVYSPDLFIPVSKKIKVYDIVTKEIINKSFKAVKNSDLEININLSFEDIVNPEIYSFIIEKLKSTKMGSRVTFELLESEKVKDFEKVYDFFKDIRRFGVKVAIDDFGSGFSNFSYLTKLSPDYIKIDGSLIRDIDRDKNAQIVVETIVDFSKKLGIQTVAEFVHSSSVLSFVKNLNIDYSQGYFIDRPKPEISIN